MRVEILGIKISRVSFKEAVTTIESFLEDGKKHLVTTPYAESIVDAQKDEEFRNIINGSDLAVPDGGSLLAAAEYLSFKLDSRSLGRRLRESVPFVRILIGLVLGLWVGIKLVLRPSSFRVLRERVPGTDLVVSLCQLSAQKGHKVFLLGGRNGAAAAATTELRTQNPKLKINSLEGPSDLGRAGPEEINDIIDYINDFAPDLLFVAFKPVEQEKWLQVNRNRIKAKVFMAVGWAFDMIRGKTPRAPRILQRLNLEWLWRLLIEPWRIKRIYKAVIVFPWLVFARAVGGKRSNL